MSAAIEFAQIDDEINKQWGIGAGDASKGPWYKVFTPTWSVAYKRKKKLKKLRKQTAESYHSAYLQENLIPIIETQGAVGKWATNMTGKWDWIQGRDAQTADVINKTTALNKISLFMEMVNNPGSEMAQKAKEESLTEQEAIGEYNKGKHGLPYKLKKEGDSLLWATNAPRSGSVSGIPLGMATVAAEYGFFPGKGDTTVYRPKAPLLKEVAEYQKSQIFKMGDGRGISASYQSIVEEMVEGNIEIGTDEFIEMIPEDLRDKATKVLTKKNNFKKFDYIRNELGVDTAKGLFMMNAFNIPTDLPGQISAGIPMSESSKNKVINEYTLLKTGMGETTTPELINKAMGIIFGVEKGEKDADAWSKEVQSKLSENKLSTVARGEGIGEFLEDIHTDYDIIKQQEQKGESADGSSPQQSLDQAIKDMQSKYVGIYSDSQMDSVVQALQSIFNGMQLINGSLGDGKK